MGSNYKMKYMVDLVFVIDATGSMSNIIDIVKGNALNFYNDMYKKMTSMGKKVDKLRVRVIAFRDYIADGDNAMIMTNFFDLPDQAEIFNQCVKGLQAEGGGDDPEDGLEALGYAIRSDWAKVESPDKGRQVIVIWSDAETHDLGYGKSVQGYPHNMAKNMGELTEWWENGEYINQNFKRLLLFAPSGNGWNFISDNWSNVIHYQSEAGGGLKETDYEQILNVICKTV